LKEFLLQPEGLWLYVFLIFDRLPKSNNFSRPFMTYYIPGPSLTLIFFSFLIFLLKFQGLWKQDIIFQMNMTVQISFNNSPRRTVENSDIQKPM